MNPQPTLQTLPIDCLIEISSYLSLPECMFLRSSSRQLKAAVDEHFRTGVRTLPVVLSARHSPESIALYDEYCQQKFEYSDKPYEKFAYGSTSGASQLEVYDDKAEYKLEDYDAHFRSDNFLVLFDLAKFSGFVHFITKYLPGITKLALIIDHKDHMNHVPEVLNLYRKQLKVLVLEETAHLVKKLEYNSQISRIRPLKIVREWRNFEEVRLSAEFFQSIDDLEALEELHFFPKALNMYRYIDGGKLEMRHFLKRMLQKLKLFHFEDYTDFYEDFDSDYYSSAVFENLETLFCNGYTIEIWRKASFSRLETIVLNERSIASLKPEAMPSLRTIRGISEDVFFDEDIEILNQLSKIERIHFKKIYPFEGPTMVNRTIKFIEIDRLLIEYSISRYTEEEQLKRFKESLRCFHGLEKVIVREPFMEFTGSDLLRIHQ